MGGNLSKREEVSVFSQHALALAERLCIRTALVLADELGDPFRAERGSLERVIWLAQEESAESRSDGEIVIPIPGAKLTRMSQINLGLYSATLRGYLELDENVLCLSGIAGSGRLDLMLVTQPNRDFPWLRTEDLERTRGLIPSQVFGRLLGLVLRFAAQGREGKSIGAIFVVGEMEQLDPFIRQLILNPCKGHPRKLRSLHNPDFEESLREFCAIDGAVIVNKNGVVESVGTYLDAPTKNVRLQPGQGARHAAAAAITKVTDSIAFAISESSGSVTLFDNGKPVLELERPR